MAAPRNSIQAVAQVMELLELAQNGNTELAGRCAQLEHELANARRCIRIHETANMENANTVAAELAKLRADNAELREQLTAMRKSQETRAQHLAVDRAFATGFAQATGYATETMVAAMMQADQWEQGEEPPEPANPKWLQEIAGRVWMEAHKSEHWFAMSGGGANVPEVVQPTKMRRAAQSFAGGSVD